jgi:hypothetical protein
MKKLIFILCGLFSFGVSAQPTIGTTNMPQNGDTLRYSSALPDSAVLATFNNTGANQTWNFSNLIPIRQALAEYFASNQTPYNVNNRTAELFADTLNLGPISVFDVYEFYNNSSSEFAADVRGFSLPNPLPFPPILRVSPSYLDKDEIYQFPLNYLDRDSSTFNFQFSNSIAGIFVSSAGYRINEVEAWGNITTPYGTFSCIKVKTDIVSYDTVSFGTNNFGINNHQREYKWLSPQLRFPVANLSGNVIGGVFIPQTIQYRDSVRSGIGNIFAPFALFNADTTIINLGNSVRFSNNTLSLTPATYQWSISPATHTYINGTDSTTAEPEVQFNALGFYDVQLIAQNTSGNDTLLRQNYIEVRQTTALSESVKVSTLKVYPNPLFVEEELVIEAESAIERILLYDQQARLLNRWEPNNQQRVNLSLQMLKPGHYYLQIDLDGNRITKKVILR